MSAVKAAGKEIHYSGGIAYVRPMCSGPQWVSARKLRPCRSPAQAEELSLSAGGRWIASAAQSHLSKSPVGIELAINAPALPRTVLDGDPDATPRSEEFRAEDWDSPRDRRVV